MSGAEGIAVAAFIHIAAKVVAAVDITKKLSTAERFKTATKNINIGENELKKNEEILEEGGVALDLNKELIGLTERKEELKRRCTNFCGRRSASKDLTETAACKEKIRTKSQARRLYLQSERLEKRKMANAQASAGAATEHSSHETNFFTCDALGCKLAHWHKIPVIEEEGGVCPGDTEDNSHKRASVVSSSSFATALLVEDDLEDEVENDVVDDVNGEVVSDAEDADEDDSVGTASDVDPSEQTLEAAVGILRTLVVPYNFYITPAGDLQARNGDKHAVEREETIVNTRR